MPAARKIQNGLYRKWKAREPLRHFNAATIIQSKIRYVLAQIELQRRKVGFIRKKNNIFGKMYKLHSIFEKVERQTKDRLYHPQGDMYLQDDIDLGRFLSRLGLRSLTNTFMKRNVNDLQSLFSLCNFNGKKIQKRKKNVHRVYGKHCS